MIFDLKTVRKLLLNRFIKPQSSLLVFGACLSIETFPIFLAICDVISQEKIPKSTNKKVSRVDLNGVPKHGDQFHILLICSAMFGV